MALTVDYGPVPDDFSGKWNLRHLPPEGHPEVGKYFYRLFMEALNERTRLDLDKRMDVNYRMYRGNHWGNMMGILTGKATSRLSLALLSTNIQKTVANICAKSPTAQVRCDDGRNDDADKIVQQNFVKWHNTEEITMSLQKSVLNMEIYGITIEKSFYDIQRDRPDTVVVDPYSFLPAPGYYEKLNDAPYLVHLQAMPVDDAEAIYGVSGLTSDESVFTILGEHREDYRRPVSAMASQGSGRYGGNYVPARPVSSDGSLRYRRVLVAEIWIRDFRKKSDPGYTETPLGAFPENDKVPLFNSETGVPETVDHNPQLFQTPVSTPGDELPTGADAPDPELSGSAANAPTCDMRDLYYPGGIRKVVICNTGIVLEDAPNPCVNMELPYDLVSKTYLFDHFPFSKANSYEDPTSLWGFSQCELTGDINLAVDKLWSNLMYHLNMALFPPLILPKDTKVPKNTIHYAPRLIIEPVSTASASNIKFLALPAPPAMLFQTLETLVKFFDRISALEDPASQTQGAAAASALQMLMERASLLIQSKIRAVDYLVRQRGRCAISLWLNFGTEMEKHIIDGIEVNVRGVDLVGRPFDYCVDSGSTVARSGSQSQAQALQLFQLGAIDREALLKELAFPNYSEVLARVAVDAAGQAIQVLQQAGLPPELVQTLQAIMQQINAQRAAAQNEADIAAHTAGTPPPGTTPGRVGPAGPAPAFGQQPGQGMQVPGQGGLPGASPSTGAPGGAVGTGMPGSTPGAPSQPGMPKSMQGLQ